MLFSLAISPVSFLWLADPHDLQDITLLGSPSRLRLPVGDTGHYCPHGCGAYHARHAFRPTFFPQARGKLPAT
jgi:hypothetical protein